MKKLSVQLSLLLLLAALLIPMVGCKKEEPMETEENAATEAAPATEPAASTEMSTDMSSSDMAPASTDMAPATTDSAPKK
jgi:hypothetical protein